VAQGDGRRHAEVVAVVFQTLAHFEDVTMSLGRQQPHLGPLTLQQGIGGDRRAVDDAFGFIQQRREVFVEFDRQKL
jgi:hypothetical protein